MDVYLVDHLWALRLSAEVASKNGSWMDVYTWSTKKRAASSLLGSAAEAISAMRLFMALTSVSLAMESSSAEETAATEKN